MEKECWARLRSDTVRKGWFFSYLLVLAVPLLLCLLLYVQAYHIIRSESETMYNSALEQVRIDMDSYLSEVQQILEQTLLDSCVQKATRIAADIQPEDQLTIVDTRDNLQHLLLSYPNISNISLMMNRPDGVVTTSGYMSQEIYYKLYCRSEAISQEEFQEYVRQPHNLWDMLALECADGKQYLLFPRTTMDNYYSKSTSTAVVTVDLSLLRQRLQAFSWDSRLHLYIIAPDSRLICDTIDSPLLELLYEELEPNSRLVTMETGDKTGGVLVRESGISGWRYVLLAESSLLEQSARRIQLYTYFGLLICMLLGLSLSHFLTKRNYHPLHEMIGRFSSHPEAPALASGNEYAQLDRYIQEFFTKRGDEQHALWSSQQALRKYQLYTLLERPCSGEGNLPDGLEGLPEAGVYIVVLFSIPPAGRGGKSGNDLLQYAVANIFEEVAGAHFPLETTIAGENVAAIVTLPTAQSGLPGALEEDIRFTQQQIAEHFHLTVEAAVGDSHPHMAGIHYSYREALEAASYQHAGQETDLVAYCDIRDVHSSYVFSLEEERKLIDLIAAGKNEEARAVLSQVFDGNNQQSIQSASVARCLAYDVMSALVKGANMAGVNGLSVLRFVEIDHCPPPELPVKLGELVDLLCQKVRDNARVTTAASHLCEDICAYIRANYQNPDLNISQTGLQFDLTPAYLSALFKRETGTSLLGYITQVRLDAAKGLLMQGQPVARIAEQCGFRDSSALIRVFKKSTGLTPGQYKSIHSEEALTPS